MFENEIMSSPEASSATLSVETSKDTIRSMPRRSTPDQMEDFCSADNYPDQHVDDAIMMATRKRHDHDMLQ